MTDDQFGCMQPSETSVQTLTELELDTELLSPVKWFCEKLCIFWSVVLLWKFRFGGQKFIVLRTLWTDRTINSPDSNQRPDKQVKMNCQVFRQVFAARQSSETESALKKQCSPKMLREHSDKAVQPDSVVKIQPFDKVVQPEKAERFFFESTWWKSKNYT